VVLISIDTLRADALGCYGYSRDTSPVIDRLAAEGVRFEQVSSSTTWTLPAHVALLTSLPDAVHGVVWDTERLDGHRVTLAEALGAHGYETFGVFTGPYLQPRFGFAQGFDHYVDATLFDKGLEGPEVLVASERGRTTPGALREVERFLNGRDGGRPFFVFLHLFDVHPDFDPPEPYRSLFDPGYEGDVTGTDVFHDPAIHRGMPARDLDHLRALYDGEIRYVDERGVGGLLELLAEHGHLDDSLVVVTSDHGEEFFEHGEFGHRKNLFETTLRIPLIVWRPGVLPPGAVVEEPVRIIDVMPTILDVLGQPQSPEGVGASLLPLIDAPPGAARERPNYAGIVGGGLHLEAVRLGHEKVIMDFESGRWSYYDLGLDPSEQAPVRAAATPAVTRAVEAFQDLRRRALALRDSLPRGPQQPVEIEPELREHLRALGYADP
jgi:arylsulfatase A-like enzyme